MPIIRIDDGRDPRIADYAGVREPTFLRERRLLIAEGRFVVRRLIDEARVRVRSLLLNEAAAKAFGDVLDRVAASADVCVASPDVIRTATGFHMHRGCLALAERPSPASLDQVLASAQLVVVLERVVDPDNVGSVFRSAEAFGVDAVVLSPGCTDPFYRKAIRTSSGATLMVPHANADAWPDAVERLRTAGFTVVGTTPAPDAVGIGRFVAMPEARARVAVMFGTEGQGLTHEALALSDVRVRIPMRGAVDSINIATAAGIVLHRLHDARHADELGRTSDQFSSL
jgi:tRNA G18 (ribose-2'-O)-methylase SpoU